MSDQEVQGPEISSRGPLLSLRDWILISTAFIYAAGSLVPNPFRPKGDTDVMTLQKRLDQEQKDFIDYKFAMKGTTDEQQRLIDLLSQRVFDLERKDGYDGSANDGPGYGHGRKR